MSLQCGQCLCHGVSLPALSSAVCHMVRIPAMRQVSHPAHPFSPPLPCSMCVDGGARSQVHRVSPVWSLFMSPCTGVPPCLFCCTIAISGCFSPFPGFRLSTLPHHTTRHLDLMEILLPLVLTWSLESLQKLQQSRKQIRPKASLKGAAVLARTKTEAWGLIPNQRQIAIPSLLLGHGTPEIRNASGLP